jgi:hypothetical protein
VLLSIISSLGFANIANRRSGKEMSGVHFLFVKQLNLHIQRQNVEFAVYLAIAKSDFFTKLFVDVPLRTSPILNPDPN